MRDSFGHASLRLLLTGALAGSLILSGCGSKPESESAPAAESEQVVESEPTTESEPTAESEPASTTQRDKLIELAQQQGLTVLTGTVNIHYEDWGGGRGNVVSLTLDEPMSYITTYKGSASECTAQEVKLAYDSDSTYHVWQEYEGRHVDVTCEGLTQAIHDASMQGVDTIALGEVAILE